jgi:hypothetical protein
VVPVGGESLATNGTLDDTKLALLRTASNTLAGDTGAAKLGVWSRPTTSGGSDGAWNSASAVTVNDKVAILSSRRD